MRVLRAAGRGLRSAWAALNSEQGRVSLIAVLVLVALGGLAFRLVLFHIFKPLEITPLFNERKLHGMRGRIFDRNGDQTQMAVSLPGWQFSANWCGIKQEVVPELNEHNERKRKRILAANENTRQRILATVSDVLALPREQVEVAFCPTNAAGRTNSWAKTLGFSAIPSVHHALVEDALISGVDAKDIGIRSYPQGCRMSHVLGFVSMDNNTGETWGRAGVEYQFNRELKGTDGLVKTEIGNNPRKNKTGREIPERRQITAPAIPGYDIYLTLDNNLQYAIEQVLKEGIEGIRAKENGSVDGAWAIVQNVHSGAILAMASYPDFDPGNPPALFTNKVLRNSAISTKYEPGSIMKSVTVAAAISEKLVTPDTRIHIGFGPFVYAGSTLGDHVHPDSDGCITVATALAKSSNIACAKIGLMLGPRRTDEYMRKFGFGSKLGIDLPGESDGILDPWKTWDKVKPTRVPIGHGVAVTGIQMVNAYSAIANGGKLMRPYVVDRIVSSTGIVISNTTPQVIGTPISPEVAKAVREMLVGVTEDGGTGTRANVKGYTIAGKTGTAQCVLPRGGYSTSDYYASFVGFVPAHDPVFCVLVSFDRPRPQHQGGYVAAPIFSKIATATVRCLEMLPDQPNEYNAGLLTQAR